jgi:hypothetical protein
MKAIAPLLLLVALLPWSHAHGETDAPAKYRIEATVWSGGELRGRPELILEPGTPGRFEIHGPNSSWRIGVDVEPPSPGENADPDALWLRVGIEQRVDDEWVFLTDTMLGTPLGRPGRISVVEDSEGEAQAEPEDAALYLELTAEAVHAR